MASPLKALRQATMAKQPITLLKGSEPVEAINDADSVKLGNQVFALDETTNFYNEDQPQTLRAVVFCWTHDKSSIVDYKNECSRQGIADFKFLVKAELTAWLNGSSDSCTFVKDDSPDEDSKKPAAAAVSSVAAAATEAPVETTGESGTKKRKLEDPQIDRILEHERASVDHNAALRGSKNIDFGYLVSDAKQFISQLKGSRSKSSSSSKSNGSSNTAKKQPIIIVSPATTALVSLVNIKEFLEDGKFVDPNQTTTRRPSNGVLTLTHPSEKLITMGHHFMVVDNVEVFTKPEYWDRVVAIFITGQTWQFAKYKYSKPEELFQKYAGYFVSYQGDVVPKQIKDWNINEIKVDRGDKRFRDKMVVRDFWIDIEKILISKGYGKSD